MKTTREHKFSVKARHAPFVEETPCYCIRLRRAANTITDFYDSLLKPFGVTITQFSTLIALKNREGGGTGELARYMGLEKSTLVRSLQPLIKAKLVEDTAPGELRIHHWRLSATGRELVEKAMPVWKKAQADIRTALAGNHRQLFEILEGLNVLLYAEEEGAPSF